ncbi:MAG: hypothetical protein A2X17_00375 [Bacteroidetes bacterium GWF2_41_61]|nr:MAG: hypothetical protein A2X20_05650 [Bacteroidetes bacterium GWE2_40_15]OFY27979.1 MAG: hypothetical protein A2X17_00375 [Bacteroidetes bacterium GWF2_41_61]OFY90592.1 MAG: hypothetical protein A2266_10225 [Bacteroidetes bacterium RIFOXYA12_FULL_40_10]
MNFIKYTFRSLFLIYIFTIIFASLYSFKNTSVDLSGFIFGIRADRLIHFIMFLPFPFFAWLAFGTGIKRHTIRFSMSVLALSGLLISTLTETLQTLNPNRDFDYVDLIANYSAIIMGTILVALIEKYAKNVWPSRLQ